MVSADIGFEVPTLRNFKVVNLEMLDPKKAEEEAKRLRQETLPELQKQVTGALDWLARANNVSREAQEILFAEIARKQDKENATAAQEGRKSEVFHPREWLNSYLEHEFGPYRRTAWLALLLYHFNGPKTKEQAEAWLATLCKKGRLSEDMNGALIVFGKNYSVAKEANLGEPEIRQLRQAITNLESRIVWEEKLREQNQRNTLFKEGNLSTEEFFRGKPGLLSVMPSVNGNYQVAGVLVVRSTGKEVYPNRAVGFFHVEMEELAKTGKSLLIYTLNWTAISPGFFTKKAHFSQKEAELLMKFWQLLKSGIARKEKKERIQTLRERLAAQASITIQEYLLGAKSGVCFLEKEGRWDWHQTPVHNLFFVVERKVDEAGASCTRLKAYPIWLREFFADCPVDTWWPEGEKFAGLPQNLRMVLQSIRGQTEKHLLLEASVQVQK